ncbi:MAG: hypothetical protein LBS90_07705 [Oscillospiraceae bacterium]|jgi:hypothetical protein|nr:hypothetical protein [Oscillospiraceae bacterium]
MDIQNGGRLTLGEILRAVPDLTRLTLGDSGRAEYLELADFWVGFSNRARREGWGALTPYFDGREELTALTDAEKAIFCEALWSDSSVNRLADLALATLTGALLGHSGEKPLRLVFASLAAQSILDADNPNTLKSVLYALLGGVA